MLDHDARRIGVGPGVWSRLRPDGGLHGVRKGGCDDSVFRFWAYEPSVPRSIPADAAPADSALRRDIDFDMGNLLTMKGF